VTDAHKQEVAADSPDQQPGKSYLGMALDMRAMYLENRIELEHQHFAKNPENSCF